MSDQKEVLQEKKQKNKMIPVLVATAVIVGVLFLLEYVIGPRLDENTSRWLVPVICWIMGGLAWIITYIGAPRASISSGHYVSGVPGMAFICFLAAGLVSPVKWLALLCLLDNPLIYRLLYRKKQKPDKTEEEK